MITAVMDVIKNTRPKYRIAMIAAKRDHGHGEMPRFLHGLLAVLAERLALRAPRRETNPCLDCNMAAVYNEIDLTPPNPRILALDLGKKRIGLAISDPLRITAQGLPNLVRTNKRADLEALGELIRGARGRPDPDGQSDQHARHGGPAIGVGARVRRCYREALGLPVKFWDERLTSVEAGRVLRSSGISIEKRAAAVDRLSAVILLQSYLDSL